MVVMVDFAYIIIQSPKTKYTRLIRRFVVEVLSFFTRWYVKWVEPEIIWILIEHAQH